MAQEGQLYQMCLDGYWMDIGQPKDYLIGQKLFLQSQRERKTGKLAESGNIKGDVMIHPTAKVHPDAELGPNVVVGADCIIGPGCKIYDSTIMARTTV